MPTSSLHRRSAARPARPSAPGYSRSADHANGFYTREADGYAARTLSAPSPALFDPFVRGLRPGARVLDLGCGAGRELLALRTRGFDALGVDLSSGLAAIARRISGAEVIGADMRTLEFETASFDGVLAVASLLHLTADDLTRQLGLIHTWLRPGGLFLASMKMGQGSELTRDGRAFHYVSSTDWSTLLTSAGFADLKLDLSEASLSHSSSDHPWLASLGVKR